MTCDLRRLRLHGLIERLPGRHRYVLTPRGRRVALFFSEIYARVLRPVLRRTDPALPPDETDELRAAGNHLHAVLDEHVREGKLPA